MSGFDANWLRQREPFDLAARSDALARAFVGALAAPADRPRRLLDLAGGTAANFRALAPLIDGDQQWWLLDLDPALLAASRLEVADWARSQNLVVELSDEVLRIRGPGGTWALRSGQIDLAESLESVDASAFDGVTTTAFLDLVSVDWLDRLAAWVCAGKRPLLATLSVDGRRIWSPALPDDGCIGEAFRRHQGGDKGFGVSIGPAAAPELARRLQARGRSAQLDPSDWWVAPSTPDMLERMAREAHSVACEADPAHRVAFDRWLAQRCAQIGSGQASLVVGHLDLLSIP